MNDEQNEDRGRLARIFVYGTLRSGFGNHQLLGNSYYAGEATTPPKYSMLHLGGFPGIIAAGETSIKGELYDVDEVTLRRLDRLEGHPDFYKRTNIEVQTEEGRQEVEAYLLPTHTWLGTQPLIESGDWKERG